MAGLAQFTLKCTYRCILKMNSNPANNNQYMLVMKGTAHAH